jgi:hypothetical protein
MKLFSIFILLASTVIFGQTIFLGDLNDDQNVDVIDCIIMVQIALGDEPSNHEWQAGNLNNDYIINIQDIIIIIEIIMEILCTEDQSQCNPYTLNCCVTDYIDFDIQLLHPYAINIFDFWIFSEDYILAIGEFQIPGEGYQSGGIWNGEEWEILRFWRDENSYMSNLRGVWAFSQTNVWFAGGSIWNWDGNESYMCTDEWIIDFSNYPDEGVYEIWAASEESIYFVGPGGCVRHYNGSEFIRLESGTDIQLKDIWGYVNPNTGTETVWICGLNSQAESVLISCVDEECNPVYDVQEYQWDYLYDHLSGQIISLWASDNFLYVLTPTGLYQCDHNTNGEATLILPSVWGVNYRKHVRGTSDNDIFVVGNNQEIIHFNGENWELLTNYWDDRLKVIDVTENVIIAGGTRLGLEGYFPNVVVIGQR